MNTDKHGLEDKQIKMDFGFILQILLILSKSFLVLELTYNKAKNWI